MDVRLIFDIGKTNKKYFVLDENYGVLSKSSVQFDEIHDEDNFPCDDLKSIRSWMQLTLDKVLRNKRWNLMAINFSTYGASLVHLDKNGKPLSSFYNYLKPIPPDVLYAFHKQYGDAKRFALQTSSPALGMLNAGLQLYWLKHTRPEVFENIKFSLHLPQYLSFVLTGIPVSDFTSIGCHTGLWDFELGDYHKWVYAEGIDRILAPVVATSTCFEKLIANTSVRIGVGIHDSSAALIPYMRMEEKPFILISTGTWSIALNPFNHETLSLSDLENDCLNFLGVDGQSVKAARLFLGNEYAIQVSLLIDQFYKDKGDDREVVFDRQLVESLRKNYMHHFHFESIRVRKSQPSRSVVNQFASFEEAYHQLMMELVELQIEAVERVLGSTKIEKIYIDGGFAQNDVFVQLMGHHFEGMEVIPSHFPAGPALGAAMVMANEPVRSKN